MGRVIKRAAAEDLPTARLHSQSATAGRSESAAGASCRLLQSEPGKQLIEVTCPCGNVVQVVCLLEEESVSGPPDQPDGGDAAEDAPAGSETPGRGS